MVGGQLGSDMSSFLDQAGGDSELASKMDQQHAAAQSKGAGQDSLRQAADAQKEVCLVELYCWTGKRNHMPLGLAFCLC